MGPSGQRWRATGERPGCRPAVRHGMLDGAGAILARGACEPQGRVKVGRRREGKWGTRERVNGSRTLEVMRSRTLSDKCHNGHCYVLAWPESNSGAKL